jgi:hypothetical protein
MTGSGVFAVAGVKEAGYGFAYNPPYALIDRASQYPPSVETA